MDVGLRTVVAWLVASWVPTGVLAEEHQGRRLSVSDVWTHVGETSAVISCATSVRCGIHLDYGPTQECGFSAEPEERSGWLHFVRLAGLKPDATYYFRITAVDEARQSARSDVMTLKPSRLDEAVRVPGGLR